MKICIKCFIEQPFENFYKNIKNKSGYTGSCKSCTIIRTTKWNKNNPNKTKQYIKTCYQKDSTKERMRNFYRQPLQKIKKTTKENKRRASKLNAMPPWLSAEQKLEIEYKYWLAHDARIITGEDYHVDHIVPLKGKGVCGLHVPWNLQVLPSDINLSKGNKL